MCFCLGGIKLDALLEELGARKIETALLIDAEQTNNPELISRHDEFLQLLKQMFMIIICIYRKDALNLTHL